MCETGGVRFDIARDAVSHAWFGGGRFLGLSNFDLALVIVFLLGLSAFLMSGMAADLLKGGWSSPRDLIHRNSRKEAILTGGPRAPRRGRRNTDADEPVYA